MTSSSKITKSDVHGATRIEYGTWEAQAGSNSLVTDFSVILFAKFMPNVVGDRTAIINKLPLDGRIIEYEVFIAGAGPTASGTYQIEGF